MGALFTKIKAASEADGHIKIFFKYDPDILDLIKKAVPYPGRQWDPETKTWMISCDYIPKLIAAFESGNKSGKYIEYSDVSNAYRNYCGRIGKENEFSCLEEGKREPRQSSFFEHHVAPPALREQERESGCKSKKIRGKEDDFADFFPANEFLGSFLESGESTADNLNYPSKTDFKPYEHQISGANILLKGHKYILADTMGLGKTFTSIMAAYNVPGRKLVVTPASLKLNWRNEINKFGVDLSDIRVLSGKTMSEDVKGDEEWFILNYDILRNLGREANVPVWAAGFQTAIFDEAHYCKAVTTRGLPGSQRATVAMEIAANIPNVFLLSGTPITNKSKDIYMLLRMVDSPIAKNWFKFATRYCNAHKNNFGWDCDGASNREELNLRLRSCLLRRRTQDVLTMPEKHRTYIPVEANLRGYNALLNKYFSDDDDSSECALASLVKMKQAVALGKVENTCAVINDLLENGKSVVVYTCYLDVVDKISEKFEGKCVRITGAVSAEDRQKAVEDFQAGKKPAIICTIAAGGVGLTLTRSDVVVFNDFDYTAANIRQAEDRIWRIGQRNNCSIYFVYADKCFLDETLCAMLDKKLSNMGVIIDGREDSLITEDDQNNKMLLMQQLMDMKANSKLRRKKKGQ